MISLKITLTESQLTTESPTVEKKPLFGMDLSVFFVKNQNLSSICPPVNVLLAQPEKSSTSKPKLAYKEDKRQPLKLGSQTLLPNQKLSSQLMLQRTLFQLT